MSLESWKAEFYPVPADSLKSATDLEVAKHSLQKWIGLRKSNLEKHGVKRAGCDLIESSVDSSSSDYRFYAIAASSHCSLCVRFLNTSHPKDKCADCPLYQARGDYRCDRTTSREGISPWSEYRANGNPEPMILALVKTVAFLSRDKDVKIPIYGQDLKISPGNLYRLDTGEAVLAYSDTQLMLLATDKELRSNQVESIILNTPHPMKAVVNESGFVIDESDSSVCIGRLVTDLGRYQHPESIIHLPTLHRFILAKHLFFKGVNTNLEHGGYGTVDKKGQFTLLTQHTQPLTLSIGKGYATEGDEVYIITDYTNQDDAVAVERCTYYGIQYPFIAMELGSDGELKKRPQFFHHNGMFLIFPEIEIRNRDEAGKVGGIKIPDDQVIPVTWLKNSTLTKRLKIRWSPDDSGR